MKTVDRQTLRDAALAALAGTRARMENNQRPLHPDALDWQLQTSNSFRRIGTSYGDGDVLCGTKHPRDGHPDLLAAQGVLEYLVAAQPSVVIALLDELDLLTEMIAKTRTVQDALLKEVERLRAEGRR